jgi:hypothetical protein
MWRNWNRWRGSAAYPIDTSGKQPHEPAVKFSGRRKVNHNRCCSSRSFAVAHFGLLWTNRKQRRTMSEKPTLTCRHMKLTSGLRSYRVLANHNGAHPRIRTRWREATCDSCALRPRIPAGKVKAGLFALRHYQVVLNSTLERGGADG